MNLPDKNVLALLEKEILSLQGFKSSPTKDYIPIGFRPIENAFPNAQFPIGCVHEFLTLSPEDASATNGFIAGLLSSRMQLGGACLWISASRTLFPAALKSYGIEPHQIVFIDLKKERDVVYATEEALKCNKLVAVLSELSNISFKQSRRFQLAAEKSRVTSFLIRHKPQGANTIACISQWRINSLASALSDGMPGVGFPRWNVELLKVRNGKPGRWIIEWTADRFTEVRDNSMLLKEAKRKTV